jgi:hypothetical protein
LTDFLLLMNADYNWIPKVMRIGIIDTIHLGIEMEMNFHELQGTVNLNCFALLSVFESISFENPFHQLMKEL